MSILHGLVLILILVSASLALWFKNLYHSVIALAIFSLVLALEFYLLQAPDVAIAEAAIGAGLSTTIAIIALNACRRKGKEEQK